MPESRTRTAEAVQWKHETPLVSALEATLQIGRFVNYEDVDIPAWHQQAPDHSDSLEPTHLVDSAQQLLVEIPYDEIAAVFDRYETDPELSMLRIRNARKLFMIARDAIVLCTPPHNTRDYIALQTICRQFGIFADCPSTDPQTLSRLQYLVHDLHAQDSTSHFYLHSKDTLKTKAEALLNTDSLAEFASNEPKKYDHDEAHQWRKEFRRIGHAVALSAAVNGDETLRDFAAKGLAINRYYGLLLDRIDSAAQQH